MNGINNDSMAMIDNSTIPSSISYSSSSSSATSTSSRIGTISLPIQVTKSPQNNSNHNNVNSNTEYSIIKTTKENPKIYRSLQKQTEQQQVPAYLKANNLIQWVS